MSSLVIRQTRALLEVVARRHQMTADERTLTVRRKIWWLSLQRAFPVAEVRDPDLGAVEEGAVELIVGARVVRFGRGLSPVDILRVKMALQQHLDQVRR